MENVLQEKYQNVYAYLFYIFQYIFNDLGLGTRVHCYILKLSISAYTLSSCLKLAKAMWINSIL